MSAHEQLTRTEILESWEKFFTQQKQNNPHLAAINLLREMDEAYVEEQKLQAEQAKLWGELCRPQFFNKISHEKEFEDKSEMIRQVLKQKGLDKNYRDEQGKTSLDYALEASNFPLALQLVEGGLSRCSHIHFPNALFDYAIDIQHFNGIMKLLSLMGTLSNETQEKLQKLELTEGVLEIFPSFESFYSHSSDFAFKIDLAYKLNEEAQKAYKNNKEIHINEMKKRILPLLEELQKIYLYGLGSLKKAQNGKNELFKTIAKQQFQGNLQGCLKKVSEITIMANHIYASTLKIKESIQFLLLHPTHNADSIPFFLSNYFLFLKQEDDDEISDINLLLKTLQDKAEQDVRVFFDEHRKARAAILSKIKSILNKHIGSYYEDVKKFCSIPSGDSTLNIKFTEESYRAYLEHLKKNFDLKILQLKTPWIERVKLYPTILKPFLTYFEQFVQQIKDDFLTEVNKLIIPNNEPEWRFVIIFLLSQEFLDPRYQILTVRLQLCEKEFQRLCQLPDSNGKKIDEKMTSIVDTFSLVRERDKKTLKALEQERRLKNKVSAAAETEKQAKMKNALAENTRQEQKKQADKALVIENLKKLKHERELLMLILTKGNHDTLKDTDLEAVFSQGNNPKLFPFHLENTKSGFILKFHSTVIANFHKQHGKALPEIVFNNIRAAFESLEITKEYLGNLFAEEHQTRLISNSNSSTNHQPQTNDRIDPKYMIMTKKK